MDGDGSDGDGVDGDDVDGEGMEGGVDLESDVGLGIEGDEDRESEGGLGIEGCELGVDGSADGGGVRLGEEQACNNRTRTPIGTIRFITVMEDSRILP